MPQYSDFIDRILLQPDLLGKLCPTEPLRWDLPARIREADDAAILGDDLIGAGRCSTLLRGMLYFAVDALDEAHRIVQDEKSDLGAYLHGMLHRREPDFDNARYWFRRAGRMAFFPHLHAITSEHSSVMARQPTWDPYLFTGECEQARYGAIEKTPELVRLQRAEFEAVLGYCRRQV